VVGLLSSFSPSETRPWHQALQQGLRELGWVERENISIEYRYAEGRLDHLPALAIDLVCLKVELIFAETMSPAFAAKNGTDTIPASGSDLIESGLAQSLARPGGNITGFDQIAFELGGKRLGLLKELIPTLSGVLVLWESSEQYFHTQLERAARPCTAAGPLAFSTERYGTPTSSTKLSSLAGTSDLSRSEQIGERDGDRIRAGRDISLRGTCLSAAS
jgi:putative tryptophan/tyrosine transport system substrate-binding protein